MTKQEFLKVLRKCLSGLPKDEIEQQVNYYSEMIDDRMEEGLSEEEAVNQISDLEEIVDQTSAAPKKKKTLKASEIVLLAVGSIVWFPLLIAAAAVAISLYAAWWSVVVSLWAAFGALVGVAIGGIAGGITLICTGAPAGGIALIAAGLVCAGLSVFAFLGCKALTIGTVKLTGTFFVWLKNRRKKKEEA